MRQLLIGAGLALLMTSPVWAASVSRAPFGVTAKGEEVEVFTLKNKAGMSVKILTYGGTITEINVPDQAGKVGNVMLNLGPLKAYEARPNFSSLIGRFANRITGGGFMIDGVRYDLVSAVDGTSSHGGPGGFSTKVWKATPYKTKGKAGVRLSYVSADGENGYPGTLTTTVSFTLDEQNNLTLDYRAVTTKPTHLNLTHHAFFNLAGAGTAANHLISIKANQYLLLNDKKVATGEFANVEGTPFDLRKPSLIAEAIAADDPQIRIAKGYDHNFVLDKKPGEFATVARLSDPSTGRVMTVGTTEPGLQFYSGGPFNGSLIDASGQPIQSTFGLALEAQHYPNSPNIAAFPSTLLRPGEVYRQKTRYSFGLEGK